MFGIVETEQGLNWAVARLAQAYILCSPCDQPSYFFFVKMSPVYFFEEYPIQAYLFFYALMGCNSFKTPANLESNMECVVNIKTDDKLAITL